MEGGNLSRDQIVEDALYQWPSLAWQEQWVAGVLEGLAEAEPGEFASEAEIEAVLNKYGSAQGYVSSGRGGFFENSRPSATSFLSATLLLPRVLCAQFTGGRCAC